jgi:hypothetical protein
MEPSHVPWTLADALSDAKFRQGRPVLERIYFRLRKAGVDLDPEKCWPWPGAKNQHGYARLGSDPGGETYVHRIMYREVNGSIPAGMDVEHACHSRDPLCIAGDLCAHRTCCNPTHLEAVTRAENHRRRRTEVRGELCGNGHPFEPLRNGARTCRLCYNERMREYNRAYRAQRKAEGRPLG